MDAVNTGKYVESSPLYECNLGANKICSSAEIEKNSDFETAVVKLQRNQASTLTESKRHICASLLLENNPSTTTPPNAFSTQCKSMYSRLARKRKAIEHFEARYMTSNFLTGSAGEVERLIPNGVTSYHHCLPTTTVAHI